MIVGTHTALRNNTARAPCTLSQVSLMVTLAKLEDKPQMKYCHLQRGWVLLPAARCGWWGLSVFCGVRLE